MIIRTCAAASIGSLVFAASGLVVMASPVEAHRDGCHAQHSCPSDTGSYVCGDTGNFSECGYSSLPAEPEYDFDPPQRPFVAGPKALPKGMVTVSVTAERGSEIMVSSGGQTVYRTTATGETQVLAFRGLDGDRSYAVRATDSSGNESPVARFSATADGTPPSLDGAQLTPGTPEDAFTQLSITTGEAARWVASVDGLKTASGRTDGAQTTIGIPVRNGRHQLVMQAVDLAGNVSRFTKELNVDITNLRPIVEAASHANESVQRFSITGTPGSTGYLAIAGRNLPVQLRSDTAEVTLNLPDGTYSGGTLNLHDQFGRAGKSSIPTLTVDTARPLLRVVRRNDSSTTGRLVAAVFAEQGARVVWRILDDAGHELQTGTYMATNKARTLDVDVEKGNTVLKVEATDKAGNATTDDFQAAIAGDPLTFGDWIRILIFLLVVLLALFAAWVNRDNIKAWLRKQQHNRDVRAAQKVHDLAVAAHAEQLKQHAALMADHANKLNAWTRRKAHLEQLHEEVRTIQSAPPASAELLGAKVKKGEGVYLVANGSLIEQRTRQNVPTLVEAERGRVAITNLRVLFQGPTKKREWSYDKVEQLTELNSDASLLRVSNRKSLSGVSYDNPERTRALLAIAMDPANRARVAQGVATLLNSHTSAPPTAPAPPPPAPAPPAILLAGAGEEVTAEAPQRS